MTGIRLPGWRLLTRAAKKARYELSRRVHPRYSPTRQHHLPQPVVELCRCGGNHRQSDATWSGIDRPIFFTYRFGTEWAAAIQLRAFQVSQALVSLGCPVPVAVQPIENLARARPRNSVIIVGRTAVRPASEPMVTRFINDGNLVLFDMVDGEVSPRVEHLPHAYVCASLSEKAAREQAGHTTIVSLMSPDQRCPVVTFHGKDFGIGYHGLPKNVQHADSLNDITVVDYREAAPLAGELPMPVGWDEMATFSHHYSVRAWNPGDGFKPLMKAFVAARLGSCFIGSADDPEALLILPDDYPYLARSSALADVEEIISNARATYQTPVWDRAVEIMMGLRQRSCPANTALELIRGISDLLNNDALVKSSSNSRRPS